MNRQDARSARIEMDRDRISKTEPGEEIDESARKTLAAAVQVHKHLSPGYLESVYEEALAVELTLMNIPFVR